MVVPKRNLKARSAVTSRKSSLDSPVWTSAKEVFKSPSSPSPVRRVTRRTSVYQSKASSSDSFKMPLPKMVLSPPGVKTRARRSSIYQKGGGKLISPKNTRARRASMYISSKTKQEPTTVFSKVWATPIRQPETVVENSPEKPVVKEKADTNKTPKSVNKSNTTENRNNSSQKSPTPKKISKTPKVVQPVNEKKENESSKQFNKTPKRSPTKASPKQQTKSVSKSTKKSPNTKRGKNTSPVQKKASMIKQGIVTSTPTKSLEQITGKSFYATPGETPIQSQRTDDIFVFSAKPVKSAKKSLKKSVQITPVETPKKSAKTPKRMPTRNTPAVKRSRLNDSADSDASLRDSPPAKRVKATPRTLKSVKRSVKKVTSVDDKVMMVKEKPKLSPVQMSSVLKSVTETEKRKALDSPSPRPTKRAKVDAADQQTPRVFKTVKRSSPKNLAEVVSISQNTNNNGEEAGNTSLLNDTINSDSRGGRCIIL
ncbi:negative elongation factor A-like [Ruditapes philippinarum]|uniref:negative elongation factor A-like n=1 Tax=Ruditapes philippinarum TaxID=129788 RepID=UPI00295A6436|nr:negative elongation factor A-like [Ruditapes philippinarum]